MDFTSEARKRRERSYSLNILQASFICITDLYRRLRRHFPQRGKQGQLALFRVATNKQSNNEKIQLPQAISLCEAKYNSCFTGRRGRRPLRL